jgi:type II secretory pathway component PulF
MSDVAPEYPSLSVAGLVAWRVIPAAVITLVIVALWFTVSPLLAIASPILIIMFLPELAGMSTRVRRERATVILSYLEQAVRLNLPLPGMLDAARESEGRTTARRLNDLAELLEKGVSVATALRHAVPEASPRVIGLIGAAERTGQLPQALARIAREDTQTPEQVERSAFGRWYPLLMTLVILGVVSMLMIFVVPKMVEIYKDYGLTLPRPTRLLIAIARDVYEGEIIHGLPLTLVVIVLVAIAILGGMFQEIWTPLRPRWRFDALDRLAWWLPVWHKLTLHRGLADACDTLAGALRAGLPLPRAIEEAATLGLNPVLRDRLQLWQGGIERGMPADQAAREAQLPELFCGMIGGARGDVPLQAVEFLASYYHSRFSRGREMLSAAAVPVMAIVFGGIVLFVAAGLYTPLLTMMDHLNDIALKVSK